MNTEQTDNQLKKQRVNYVFIDYENVQPSSIVLNVDAPFKIFLFTGANQTKIPIELAASLQPFGSNVEYVKIEGNGKNALDFHLAFYIGKMFERDSTGYFHIISKDSGFDILIKHLRDKKVSIQRHNQISDIPILKISNTKSIEEKLEGVLSHLETRGSAKPRKVETLTNTINALFLKKLESDEIKKIIDELARKKLITIEESKVHYHLTH